MIAGIQHSHRVFSWRALALFTATALLQAAYGQIPEQYPKPLLHTPQDHPAQRVLMIVVDGLSAHDLSAFVATHPGSALAEMSRRGVTYTNAHAPWPDPAAALLTLVSGGSPISTGIFSSRGFDRSLQLGGAGCRGGEAVALNLTGERAQAVAPTKACAPMLAHQLVRVNSIFDLVHQAGGRTAWAGAGAGDADLLRGPSGHAVDDVFVAAAAPAVAQDTACVDAVVGWLERGSEAPRLVGIDLVTLDATRRSLPVTRVIDAGWPGSAGVAPLELIDAEVARLMTAMKKSGLYDTTWTVVTARFADTTDASNLRTIDAGSIARVAEGAAPSRVARVSTGTAAMVWLKNASDAAAVVRAYRVKMNELGIAEIYSGDKLHLVMNTAAEDSHMPDIILQPQAGVQWSSNHQWPEHLGGFSDEENHVAMLISGKQLTGREDRTPVPTGQVAPLMVRMLGMEKFGLDALHEEHVPALPGIF